MQRREKPAFDPAHGNNQAPLWTQEESIAFESALETIGHLIAIYSSLLAQEKSKTSPDFEKISLLRSKQSLLSEERLSLGLKDYKKIERIEQEYGLKIKAYNLDGKCPL